MKGVILLWTAAALGWGQDAQMRGRQIVEEALAALGGEKFLSVETRVETGRAYSFFQDRLTGLAVARFYTRYVPVDPAKTGSVVAQQEHQALGKDEGFYQLFRDDGGWEVTYRGPTALEKERVERWRDSTLHNVFYILRVRRREEGLVFEWRGSDIVDNTPVNVVDIIDAQNRTVTVYFHPTTKLPVRQQYIWRDPQTRERNVEVTRFSRYREVGGTQWPYQVHRERNGRKIYEMFADSVEVNVKIDERRFATPDASSRPFGTPNPPRKKR
jgi:hypothetical protein